MTITIPLEHKQVRTPPAPLGGQARGERPHTPVASARLFSIQQPQAGAGNAEREARGENQGPVSRAIDDPKIIRPRFGARPRLAFHHHPSVAEIEAATLIAAECIRRSHRSIRAFEKSIRQLPSCSTDNGAGQWKKIFDRAGRISP